MDAVPQFPVYDRVALISLHLAEVGTVRALRAVRPAPVPAAVQGLRFAQTWLMSPLRTGALPSANVTGVALIAAWDDDRSLDRYLSHPTARVYREGWNARCEPVRTVGAWPGLPDLPRREEPTGEDPVAVLTMARVRLHRWGPFAAAAGPAEREARRHPAFLAGTSLLRPPGRVATLSLWRTAREMRQYTVGSCPGGHADAMKRHQEKEFHYETVFVRLRPYATEGRWGGRDPLGRTDPATRG
ncbi:spheroidene monooxygenase [Streptomyces sp. NPDC016845]|uniref:spheroidene monooxygenase n=1 Tax=Streptomyces sp. NPDC016845 TaxID=3364972 RepID=UPI00379E1147